jgi:GNAT superfamily N-acetyltransferase
MRLSWRYATHADLDLLASWNHQLIADEAHRNPMNVQELRARMQGWLPDEYKAVIFSDEEPVAHALFKVSLDCIHLRQFFVRRDCRRLGFGSQALGLLRSEVWPKDIRLTVEVLCSNQGGLAFWHSVGYQDYGLTLEVMPGQK